MSALHSFPKLASGDTSCVPRGLSCSVTWEVLPAPPCDGAGPQAFVLDRGSRGLR